MNETREMWGSWRRERAEHLALIADLDSAVGDVHVLAVEAIDAHARLIVRLETLIWMVGLMTAAGSCAGIAFGLAIADDHSGWQAAGYTTSYALVLAAVVLSKVKNGSGPLWKRNVETVKDNLLLTIIILAFGVLLAYLKVAH